MADWNWLSFTAGVVVALLLAGGVWMYCEFRDAPVMYDDEPEEP